MFLVDRYRQLISEAMFAEQRDLRYVAMRSSSRTSEAQPIDPSLMIELLRPIEPEELKDNAYGRVEFLFALQLYFPDFWRSLKAEVADRCEHFDRDHSDEIDALFREWADSHCIADLWLQDACWE